jgi:hypothetical protein
VIDKYSGTGFHWQELDLRSIQAGYVEIRPGRFIKIYKGKVISEVSRAEVIWDDLDLEGYTNRRNIAIFVGLTALMWLLVTFIADPLSRAIFIVGYICFSILFFISHAAYTIPKLRWAGIDYFHRKKLDLSSQINYVGFITWVLVVWPIRLLRGVKSDLYSKEKNQLSLTKEFRYSLFFWAMVIFWGIFLPLITRYLIL